MVCRATVDPPAKRVRPAIVTECTDHTSPFRVLGRLDARMNRRPAWCPSDWSDRMRAGWVEPLAMT
jgi:hypothetical protein